MYVCTSEAYKQRIRAEERAFAKLQELQKTYDRLYETLGRQPHRHGTVRQEMQVHNDMQPHKDRQENKGHTDRQVNTDMQETKDMQLHKQPMIHAAAPDKQATVDVSVNSNVNTQRVSTKQTDDRQKHNGFCPPPDVLVAQAAFQTTPPVKRRSEITRHAEGMLRSAWFL